MFMSVSFVQGELFPLLLPKKGTGKKTGPPVGQDSLFAGESGTTPLKNTFITMLVFFKPVVHSLTGY